MMEWVVVWGEKLAGSEHSSSNFYYLKAGDVLGNLFELYKPLLSVMFRLIEGAGVNETAEVLVQVFCEDVEIQVLEPFIEFVEEFALGGFGSVGHLGEVMEDG